MKVHPTQSLKSGYENRVKNDRKISKFSPLGIFPGNEVIQSWKIQNNLQYLCCVIAMYVRTTYSIFGAHSVNKFYSKKLEGFPFLHDKREWEFQKLFLSFFTIFLCTHPTPMSCHLNDINFESQNSGLLKF